MTQVGIDQKHGTRLTVSASLTGFPLCMVDKPHHMHLIYCSNNASALDMSAPLVEDLLKLEDGMYTCMMPPRKNKCLCLLPS